jgi:serine acetyltransferase
MADIGDHCMVAAGSVVASPLPRGVMVAGNPARFVRRITSEPAVAADATSLLTVR